MCGLYLNPPTNAVVWSVDKKSGMQAKSRINPTRPAVPGKPVRTEFEYKRNGTAVLFAALDVHDGGIAGWVTDSTRSENFVDFLADRCARRPRDSTCTASPTTSAATIRSGRYPHRADPSCVHPLHAHLRQLAQPG